MYAQLCMADKSFTEFRVCSCVMENQADGLGLPDHACALLGLVAWTMCQATAAS